MNKDILKKWIAKVKEFSKQPDHLHLRFPMFLPSHCGDLYSPEGLLCNLHAEATGTKWNGELYCDSYIIAPDVVLEWVDIGKADMSTLRSINCEHGFDGVIKRLEEMENADWVIHYGKD